MTVEWVGAIGTVFAAFISGVFVIVATRLRRENTGQHKANQASLNAISEDVSEVKEDIRDVRKSQERHLTWHAENKE
jgi:hypothetical protein